MNRRSFLKKLGIGAATVTLAPVVTQIGGRLYPVSVTPAAPVVATIGEWNNYVNFSDMAIAQAIDEHVQYAAEELGRTHGRSINALYQTVAFGHT